PSQLPVLNIISSHKLSAKTTRCLETLYPSNNRDTARAVGIRAKGPVAAKAITLVEIIKRRIAEKGDTWWQYNVLSTSEARPKQAVKVATLSGDSNEGEDGGEEADEDPFTPYVEKPKKQPEVPLLTIYISLARIPEFAEKCGEQT
ncbi:hypothetical protein EX30DRAFT_292938, partial [Ascodesmis nigricans]